MNEVAKLTEWTPEQLRLITDTVARGATPDELKLFLYRCQNMGLDPLKPGQIYFIKYGSSTGSIVVGIEGFRSRAAKTQKLSGIKRGAIKDEKGKLIGAYAEVYRKDWTHPAREEVPLEEYHTHKGNWVKMPETMIKKVAEAAALRMAFPDELGGVYTKEEMDQAGPTEGVPSISPGEPGPDDGFTSDSYRIDFGKYAKRSLEEVGPNDLRSYIDYLEKSAEKSGKTIVGKVAIFIQKASEYIASFENSPIEANEDVPF